MKKVASPRIRDAVLTIVRDGAEPGRRYHVTQLSNGHGEMTGREIIELHSVLHVLGIPNIAVNDTAFLLDGREVTPPIARVLRARGYSTAVGIYIERDYDDPCYEAERADGLQRKIATFLNDIQAIQDDERLSTETKARILGNMSRAGNLESARQVMFPDITGPAH